MRLGEASRTAEFMAAIRASENAKPCGERVIADPLAIYLLPIKFQLVAKLLRFRPTAMVLNSYIDRRSPGARSSGIALAVEVSNIN